MLKKENFWTELERLADCFGYKLSAIKGEALYAALGGPYTDAEWQEAVTRLCCEPRWPTLEAMRAALEHERETTRRQAVDAERRQAEAWQPHSTGQGEADHVPPDDWWLLVALRDWWQSRDQHGARTLRDTLLRHYQHARAEGLTQEPEDYAHLGRVLSQAKARAKETEVTR